MLSRSTGFARFPTTPEHSPSECVQHRSRAPSGLDGLLGALFFIPRNKEIRLEGLTTDTTCADQCRKHGQDKRVNCYYNTYMPRYTSPDMPQVTLTMLQRLDDFENYILDAESKLKDKAPESSRSRRVQSQEVELKNIRGCIQALKNSIRMYRNIHWKETETKKAG